MTKDTPYAHQKRNTRRRLKGKRIGGKTIVEVGAPVDRQLNCPTLIPIRFHDGTCAIIWDEKHMHLLVSDNPRVNRGVKFSTKMPRVSSGLGSDVVWVIFYPKKDIKLVFSRIYYNYKAGRGDTYEEVTWKAAFERSRRSREELEAQEHAA